MIEKMKRWIKNKAGVSPIIAIILMVAITVVLAATIYVWVSGFGGGGSKSMSMAITQIDGISDGSATFRVDSVSQGALWSNVNITVVKSDGSAVTYYNITNTNTGAIEAGDTFTVSDSGNLQAGYQLQFKDLTSNSIFLTKVIW